MRLAVMDTASGPGLGLVTGEEVADLRAVSPHLSCSVTDILAAGEEGRDCVIRALRKAPRLPLRSVRLRAPVARPGKILGIGLNYRDHAAETGREPPAVQLWFNKQTTAVNDPFAPVKMPVVSSALDYEVELVVVIGKRGRRVPKERAHEIIGGYMTGCDYSVRDWQKASPTMTMGKSFDTHAPVGPWVTTPDEAGDVGDMALRCWVNGELRQDGRAGDMVFDIPAMIAHLTTAFTLEPGDLLFTGTPAGVGQAFSPPRFLKVGDRVRAEVCGLGAIEAEIVPEEATPLVG